MGAVQRQGKVVARYVPSANRLEAEHMTDVHVLPSAMVYTDTAAIYRRLKGRGYGHERVNHSAGIYVSGDVHTQTIEGFFGNVKNGIAGNYHGVSTKWLQSYLNEYTWRYNRRDNGRAMFLDLLAASTSRVR